jgi:anti-anti-sigma factor
VVVTSDLDLQSPDGELAHWPGNVGASSATAGLEVRVFYESGSAQVYATGQIDRATSSTLALVLASLLGDGCTSIVLDLAEIGCLDPSRAWLIGEASRLFRTRDAQFVVQNAPAAVRDVLAAAGLGWLVKNGQATADIAPLPC